MVDISEFQSRQEDKGVSEGGLNTNTNTNTRHERIGVGASVLHFTTTRKYAAVSQKSLSFKLFINLRAEQYL